MGHRDTESQRQFDGGLRSRPLNRVRRFATYVESLMNSAITAISALYVVQRFSLWLCDSVAEFLLQPAETCCC
jgi:hypothetical protein